MRFNSLLNSNHDLKKNGYKIIRKLHKLENRANLSKVYESRCAKGYFVVLSCKGLADILFDLYGDCEEQYIKNFLHLTSNFIEYIESAASKGLKINPSVLAQYLSSYTKFFNRMIEEKQVIFSPNKDFLVKWNTGCIMAYTAVWGNR